MFGRKVDIGLKKLIVSQDGFVYATGTDLLIKKYVLPDIEVSKMDTRSRAPK